MVLLLDNVVEAQLIDEEDGDPTDLQSFYFQPEHISEEERKEIEEDLWMLVRDYYETSEYLQNLLAHYNDMAEGISQPKNFPWPNSSNLFVPLAETKLNEIHASARQTLLKGDQLYYVRSTGLPTSQDQCSKLERFLNFKIAVELPLVDKFSQLIWAAGRDGTAIAHITWADDKKPVTEIKGYANVTEFLATYPTPEESGLTKNQYDKVLEKFSRGEPVKLLETVEKSVYKGPRVEVVELQDFVMAPMTSIKTSHARLVGKIFTRRGPELREMAKNQDWSDEQVEKVIKTKEDGQRQDISTDLKDQIEGISRKSGRGEFILFNGIYRKALGKDGIEKNYLVTFHIQSKTLMGDLIKYPYLHGKDNFVPIRLKRRPNRFLGRSIMQMLDDINQEINTQHNQRIDSRTITTVPTFKVKISEKGNFDPSRPDQRFSPGRNFYLTDLAAVQQFDIKDTDMGESIQEEQNLMTLADRLTGSSQLQSGQETKMDPRAPAAKVSMLLNKSNLRLDDYFEEIAGNGEENEGLNAIGTQILALYHQFFDPDMATIPALKGDHEAPSGASGSSQPSPAGAPPVGGQPTPGAPSPLPLPQNTLTQEELNTQGRVKIQLCKTSAAMNPDALLLKFSQMFSMLINDPLVGGTPRGRLALLRRYLELNREESPEKFLPSDEQVAANILQVQQAILASMQGQAGAGKSRAGQPRTRGDQGKKPSTPSAGGSTRPNG